MNKLKLLLLVSLTSILLTSCALEDLGEDPAEPVETKEFVWDFNANSRYEVVFASYIAPTEEEIEWFELHVFEVLETAANEYPIIEVRELLRSTLEREGKDYRVLLDAGPGMHNRSASTSHHDRGPELTIMFYLPKLMENHSFYTQVQVEDYEDWLISVFMHEYRHTQQDWGYTADPAPDWVTYGRESDAEWFVAENILLPMKRGGRLNGDVLIYQTGVVHDYFNADGDQGASVWKQ